ncbi:tetratricopeptide repeat protein [Cohnella cholangitidis]|uniref:Uncharacterized protein n=1 Tax=Cohnella cholangitidis TaxID=2598458 RepID=A0A7G5C0E2_9BACL|nr:tetratricopeptide repeat protein [Cohnella cholangitidis]QMV42676.1 hypothetical protein FPL14_16880 [Cohnella cholangitidis]
MNRLTTLYEESQISPLPFRYVLTDFARSNLEFWRQHPSFERFRERGIWDIALFDAQQSDEIALEYSGVSLRPGSLSSPVVAIANYVFDSLPQDLYYIDQGQISHCLVSLYAEDSLDTTDSANALERVQVSYYNEPCAESPYPEPDLTALFTRYTETLEDSHLLFPITGLRCLHRLRSLSAPKGLLLLSADKGSHRYSDLMNGDPPELIRHGSVSLPVNYHAFKAVCDEMGGVLLFPEVGYHHVNIGALLMVADADRYSETKRAYRRFVGDFGPDDYYSVVNHARPYISEMSIEDMLALLRLSLYDAHQFSRYLPRLLELAGQADPLEREAIAYAVDKVWQLYFPLGEQRDLAFQIASLLYQLEEYEKAIFYFGQSARLYGEYTGTLFNTAICRHMLEQFAEAEAGLRKVLKFDPNNGHAAALIEEYENNRLGSKIGMP